MKKYIFLGIATLLLNALNAQSMESALTELRNENNIKAKKELLTVYSSGKSENAGFYLGNVYLKLGSVDSAIFYYQKFESSNNALSYLAKARLVQFNNNDTIQIKELIEKALSASRRKDAEIYFQAGYLAYKPGAENVQSYISYVEEAHRMDASNPYYTLILGDMYLEMNMGGKAMSRYEEVWEKDSNNILANIRMGRLYYAAKNYETAIRFLEKANSLDQKFSIVHKELGELYYLTRQLDRAVVEFKKYIELNDNDSRAKVTYGAFLFQLKDYQTAIDEVNAFILTDSSNYIFHRIIAFSYFELKKPKDAQLAMNKFWIHIGNNKVTGLDYSYAGKIAAANGDTANAIKYFKNSVLIDTLNADLQSEYAKALFNAQRYPESISEYKKRMLMKKAPMSLDYYYLGRAYFANGEYINADTTFAEFVKMQPKSPDGYLWRAKSNLEQEDKAHLKGLSVNYYLKFIELASTDINRNKSNIITAYNYLAYVALSAKDQVKAKEYFAKILEIDPENKNAADELQKLSK